MRKISGHVIKDTTTIRETGPIFWTFLSVPLVQIMPQESSSIRPDAIIYKADQLKFGSNLFKHPFLFT